LILRNAQHRRTQKVGAMNLASAGAGAQSGLIELRVERVEHLFDAFDPMPVPSRDLAPQAEDFIVGWARELPDDAPLRIVVHIPASERENAAATHAPQAFQRHFNYRADRLSGDIAELMRVGRFSLLIGLGVLAACYGAGRLLALFLPADLARFAQESVLILGWVANWRPIEIFLYAWWPLARRRRLMRRLAGAAVELAADL